MTGSERGEEEEGRRERDLPLCESKTSGEMANESCPNDDLHQGGERARHLAGEMARRQVE